MTMNNLKKCPFCNGRAVIETRNRTNKVGFYVECTKCGLRTYEDTIDEEHNDDSNVGRVIRNLIMIWNDRRGDKVL